MNKNIQKTQKSQKTKKTQKTQMSENTLSLWKTAQKIKDLKYISAIWKVSESFQKFTIEKMSFHPKKQQTY